MSAYAAGDERDLRVGRLVDDWAKSGLLSVEQRDTIAPDLHVDLRRTNPFLRLMLFVFSAMIVLSALGLVVVAFRISRGAAPFILCTVGAAACFGFAAFLADPYRLYRFGVEEAAAVIAVGLTAAGAALGWSDVYSGDHWELVAGLVAGSAAAVAVFFWFGYLYAGVAAMAGVALLPFQVGDSEPIQRTVAAGLLAVCAAGARRQRVEHGDEYPGDLFGFVEAAAWLGIYALLNLRISAWFKGIPADSWFYWVTYAGIWTLPLLGLAIAIRDRQRPLLDVSLVMLLATLMSNKHYLGAERYAWDPMVFGLFLMGAALGLRRWLASGANGARHGFVPSRVLASDKAQIGVIEMASVAPPGGPVAHPERAPADPIGGGGRSGGAGSSGSF